MGLFSFAESAQAADAKLDAHLDAIFQQSAGLKPGAPRVFPAEAAAAEPADTSMMTPPEDSSESAASDDEPSSKEENGLDTQEEKQELEQAEVLDRTLFVGNVPVAVATVKKELQRFKKFFAAYAPLESIRFRSLALAQAIPRAALTRGRIRGSLHPDRSTCNAYVVFKAGDAAAEAVEKAVAAANGTVWEIRAAGEDAPAVSRHLRVDRAAPRRVGADAQAPKHNHKNTVFVGNLSLKIEAEALWQFFGPCGTVSAVRVVRDRKTQLGKGFGFVTFRERAAVPLALKLDGQDLQGRPVRITRCLEMADKKEREGEGLHAAERRILRKTAKAGAAAGKSKAKVIGAGGRGKKPRSRPSGNSKPGAGKLSLAQQTRKMVKKLKSAAAGMGKQKALSK